MKKVNEIIDNLCSHEISKQEAFDALFSIINGFRKGNALEFEVRKILFTEENNHGILEFVIPFGYRDIEGKVKIGDRIDVTLLP